MSLDFVDCSAKDFGQDQAKLEKCNALNDMIRSYNNDLEQAKETKKGVFNDVMAFHKSRDDNWESNYQILEKKHQIKRIERELNQVVKGMASERSDIVSVLDKQKRTMADYDKLADLQEEEYRRHQDKVQAVEDKIQLRRRIVEINNRYATQKDKIIYLAKTYFVVVLLMIPAYIAYMAGSLSAGGFFAIFFGLTIAYLIFAFLENYYAGDDRDLTSQISSDISRFNRKLRETGDQINVDFDRYLSGQCHGGHIGDNRDWQFDNRGYLPVNK